MNAMFVIKLFVNLNDLKTHDVTYSRVVERPYECDVCEKRLGSSGQLNVHKRTQH